MMFTSLHKFVHTRLKSGVYSHMIMCLGNTNGPELVSQSDDDNANGVD